MLLPDPVGATKSTSARASVAATMSAWPGRKSVKPKVCSRTARARGDGAIGSVLLLFELERAGVHAVALSGGRRPIREDVTEMAAAIRAADLGARDEHAPVAVLLNSALGHGCREARPARSRVELGVGAEELGAAPGAVVDAGIVDVHVLAGGGGGGACLAEHRKLLGCQALAPLVVGEGDLLVHGAHLLPRFGGSHAYRAAAAARVSAMWARSDAGSSTSMFAPHRSSHGRISTSLATSRCASMPPPARSLRRMPAGQRVSSTHCRASSGNRRTT